MTTSLHQLRPFNTRYVVATPLGALGANQRTTHRTAQCNYWYITRQDGTDAFGPTPDFSSRTDLVDRGRVGPSRAQDPGIDGVRLWQAMDEVAAVIRPGEATLAHCVASLPLHENAVFWRDLVQGFAEDHLSSQGMVTDWAIHAQDETPDRAAILPHVHLLITTRVYDRSHPDFGKRRQAWLRTPAAAKSLAEKWYAASGLFPQLAGAVFSRAA